jgi:hypothetical protein
MTRGLPGLLVVLAVTLAPAAAWPADEAPPNEPFKSPPEQLQELLYGATPEERARMAEEQKRLSAAAASFGTDPTAIVGYYELTYGKIAYTNNFSLDHVTAIVQLPITSNWFFRATMPYVWADPNQQGEPTTNGAGDLTIRMAGRLYTSQNVSLVIGADALFPTASNDPLGTGKYLLGPGGSVAFPLPKLRSIFYTVIQDFNSVGGDPSRDNIHYLQVQPNFNTIWSERWWSSMIGNVFVDWNNDRKTTVNLQAEIGYQFDNHWNLFIRPGAGIVGRDAFLGADWALQAGVRWVFETPLFGQSSFGGSLGR